MVDNAEGFARHLIIPARSLNCHCRSFWCESQDLLFARDTNYHRRNVFHIDERIEIFRASEIGKMNDVVRYLRDLAAHFFSGSQVQFDTFAGAALKKANDRRVWLEGWLYPARANWHRLPLQRLFRSQVSSVS